MEKKIIQVIPCQPKTKVYYEGEGELNDASQVHAFALVEHPDGHRSIEPVICAGEYLDMAEGYVAVYAEEAH